MKQVQSVALQIKATKVSKCFRHPCMLPPPVAGPYTRCQHPLPALTRAVSTRCRTL